MAEAAALPPDRPGWDLADKKIRAVERANLELSGAPRGDQADYRVSDVRCDSRSSLNSCRSAYTISLTRLSNVVLWLQPSRCLAFVASPRRMSPSVGRK